MKYHLKKFWANLFVDGNDKAPWMFIDKHNISHADYDENCAKDLFAAFWPGFKDRLDKGECPADVSPLKLEGEIKKQNKKASSTTSPAPAQKLTYEYSAELPMPAHPFTFGGPAVIEIGDKESDEEYEGGVVQKEPLEGAKTKKK